MELKPPKGTKDLIGKDAILFEKILDTVKKTYEKFGFEPLFTPAFENFELFTIKGGLGEAVKDEIYYFKDKSERELGLRFDLTVPLTRVVASHPEIPKPYKRYAIAPVWRYDNPQALRYREFWQADIDIIGSNSPMADAECLACVSEALKNLGVENFFIRVNNRKTLESLIKDFVPKEKVLEVFRILDKKNKIGEENVKKELEKIGVNPKILEILKIEGSYTEVLNSLKEKTKEGIGELEKLYEYCKEYGVADKLKLDLFLVRGLDYYTSLVFEIDLGEKVSFGGGGRYDNLIGLLGKESLPATGISLGLTRIFEFLKEKVKQENKKIFISFLPGFEKEAIKISKILREKNFIVDLNLTERKLEKQLEYAEKKDFKVVLIIGEKEVKENKVRVKIMDEKIEILIDKENLISYLEKILYAGVA